MPLTRSKWLLLAACESARRRKARTWVSSPRRSGDLIVLKTAFHASLLTTINLFHSYRREWTEAGYNLYVCGNGGAKPVHAKLLATDCSEEQVLKYTDRFLMSLSLGSFPCTV